MIQPDYLQPGDKIGVIAPARKIKPGEIENGIRLIHEAGYEVEMGKNLYGENHQFSGTDNERTADFQSMLDNPDVKAIIAARGGYGCARIVDDLDFDSMIENPKWLIGFSDFTVIHSHVHSTHGVETIHAPMLYNMQADKLDEESVQSLFKILRGDQTDYEYETPAHIKPLNKSGDSEGILIGGNLSVIYSILHSESVADTRRKILFIEDLDEYLYHIDRMMMALKRARKIDNLVGLIVGSMKDMKDNEVPFGKNAEEIIRSHVDGLDFPVCFGFPAGHDKKNLPLIMGRKVDLKVDEKVSLQFLEAEIDA